MTIVINGTTGISGVDGSAGTPAVQGTDTNTGVFYPAADTVGVSTGGSERLRVDSSGNVGIGTSSPATILHVKASSPVFRLETTANVTTGGVAYQETKDSSGSVVFTQGFAGLSNCYQFGTAFSNGFMRFLTGSAVEAVRIDSSGNLKFNSGYGSVATAYGCRAWVNFNGTGTVAIRASGNVTSITDNGTGDYTVNFTNAMPDANYAFNGTTQNYSTNAGTAANVVAASLNANPTSSAFRLEVKYAGGGVVDLPYVSVAIHR